MGGNDLQVNTLHELNERILTRLKSTQQEFSRLDIV